MEHAFHVAALRRSGRRAAAGSSEDRAQEVVNEPFPRRRTALNKSQAAALRLSPDPAFAPQSGQFDELAAAGAAVDAYPQVVNADDAIQTSPVVLALTEGLTDRPNMWGNYRQ